MSDDSKTTPPAAQGGAAPACAATQPCQDKKCWPEDYEKEVLVDTYGRYFKKYKADGTTEVPLHDSVPFKIVAPVKSGTSITVEVRFKVAKDADVSDADIASAKSRLELGVSTHWNNKFKLVTETQGCPSKTFNVAFKVLWVDSGQHYTIKVHSAYDREGVTGTDMDVSKSTTAWTYAHEFGHCFGLPDEYAYSQTETQQVKYMKPDGTLDAAITAPPDGKSSTAPDATIMAAVNNTKTLPRHNWNIAIEVQDLLTQKLGRPVKCSIQ